MASGNICPARCDANDNDGSTTWQSLLGLAESRRWWLAPSSVGVRLSSRHVFFLLSSLLLSYPILIVPPEDRASPQKTVRRSLKSTLSRVVQGFEEVLQNRKNHYSMEMDTTMTPTIRHSTPVVSPVKLVRSRVPKDGGEDFLGEWQSFIVKRTKPETPNASPIKMVSGWGNEVWETEDEEETLTQSGVGKGDEVVNFDEDVQSSETSTKETIESPSASPVRRPKLKPRRRATANQVNPSSEEVVVEQPKSPNSPPEERPLSPKVSPLRLVRIKPQGHASVGKRLLVSGRQYMWIIANNPKRFRYVDGFYSRFF